MESIAPEIGALSDLLMIPGTAPQKGAAESLVPEIADLSDLRMVQEMKLIRDAARNTKPKRKDLSAPRMILVTAPQEDAAANTAAMIAVSRETLMTPAMARLEADLVGNGGQAIVASVEDQEILAMEPQEEAVESTAPRSEASPVPRTSHETAPLRQAARNTSQRIRDLNARLLIPATEASMAAARSTSRGSRASSASPMTLVTAALRDAVRILEASRGRRELSETGIEARVQPALEATVESLHEADAWPSVAKVLASPYGLVK